MSPRLIIHVGFPKCGSTSIQSTLGIDSKRLFENGVLAVAFPDESDTTYKFGYDINEFLEEEPSVANALAVPLRAEIANCWNIAVDKGLDAMVISAEHIVFHFEKFLSLLPIEPLVEVVVITRNLDLWLQSEFLQRLKMLEFNTETSFEKFLVDTKREGLHDHIELIERLEHHSRVRKIHVLPQRTTPGQLLIDLFYKEALQVQLVPPGIEIQNLSPSLDQAVLLRCIRELAAGALLNSMHEKSVLLRLGQIITKQQSKIPQKKYLKSQNHNNINIDSKKYSKWLTTHFGLPNNELDYRKETFVDFDGIDWLSFNGLRILLRGLVTIWIELDNADDREYLPNFDREVQIWNELGSILATKQVTQTQADFRHFDELLALLAPTTPSVPNEKSNLIKSPSLRLREVINETADFVSRLKSSDLNSEERQFDGISIESVKHLICAGLQVSWEIWNTKDREWTVLCSEAEIGLANSLDYNLARPGSKT